MVGSDADQDAWYRNTATQFGGAIARLAAAYERDIEKRADLAQEIHFALWRSYAHFRGACSLRTWVYRVAHNVAASHVLSQRRARTANGSPSTKRRLFRLCKTSKAS